MSTDKNKMLTLTLPIQSYPSLNIITQQEKRVKTETKTSIWYISLFQCAGGYLERIVFTKKTEENCDYTKKKFYTYILVIPLHIVLFFS